MSLGLSIKVKQAMSLVLYQFPISHFCEKIRWALDYKGLDYKSKNMLPGQHVKFTKKVAPGTSVPVLKHNDRYIQGSSKIITYLDDQFPNKKLTPVSPQASQASIEWERYLDMEFGIHVRRYVYHTLLKHRSPVIGFLASGGPFWAKPILWFKFPQLVKGMRKFMDINDTTAEQSRQHIKKALQRINDTVAKNDFLAGDYFSRADLTACALLAPLFMPPQYGLVWPKKLPEPLQSEIDEMLPQMQWAKNVYSKYR